MGFVGFLMSRNEIFVFTWIFFFHIYLHHSHRYSKRTGVSYKKVVATSQHLHVWQETMRFAIWQRQKHHLDPCVLQWLVFLFPMVLACVDLSDEHVSPLSFAASNHCQGGVISTKQETDFVLFFPFLFAFSGTQGFSKQGVFWLYAWPFCFFVFVMTVCDFDACMFVRLKKKMWGVRLFYDVFSKTGQLNDTFAKTSPSEYLIWPFILPVCLT